MSQGREFLGGHDNSGGWTPFLPQIWHDTSFSLPQHRAHPIPISTERESDDTANYFSQLSLGLGKSPNSDIWHSGTDDSPATTPIGTPILPMNELADLHDFSVSQASHATHQQRGKSKRSSWKGRSQSHPNSHSHSHSLMKHHDQHMSRVSTPVATSILQTPLRFSSPRASILIHRPDGDDELVGQLRQFFTVHVVSTIAEAKALLMHTHIDSLVTGFEDDSDVMNRSVELASMVRSFSPRIFIVFLSTFGTVDAKAQTECMSAGGNMVTDDGNELINTCIRALKVVGRDPFTVDTTYSCPVCDFSGLMEDELCDHVVLFHGGQPNCDVHCPVCGLMCKNAKVPFPVHVHKSHGPLGRQRQNIPRKQHHTYIFVLVVCQRSDGKFLMVNEPASWGWWLPGGRVEWGEGLRTAAVRETKEEAGIDITIDGILKFEYSSGPSRTRQRIIFYARPIDDNARPKCVPDYDSRGACWVSAEQVDKLPLRGEEPKMWFHYILGGGTIHSIDLLGRNRDEE